MFFKGMAVVAVAMVVFALWLFGVQGGDYYAATVVALVFVGIFGWSAAIGLGTEYCGTKEESDRLVDEIVSTFLTQELVDQKLRELAGRFDELCRTQVRLQSIDGNKQEYQELSDALKAAKQAFWRAHTLAKNRGFKVVLWVGSYLPAPTEPREAASCMDDAGAFEP